MSKSKHTPGPWFIDPRAGTHIISDGRGVASTGGYTDASDIDGSNLENVANAHLVAAAPLMLEALEAVEWSGTDDNGESCCPYCGVWEGDKECSDGGHCSTCQVAVALKAARSS